MNLKQTMATSTGSGNFVLIKIGGSSITKKSLLETLNLEALTWLVQTIKNALNEDNRLHRRRRYVIVHGAGSFGHHTANAYGLRGKTDPPPIDVGDTHVHSDSTSATIKNDIESHRSTLLLGLSRTRHSVQKLNQIIAGAFLEQDIPAITISPCFGVKNMQAHGGNKLAQQTLQDVVQSAVDAGLIPILHGDAGLYGLHGVVILSGDIIMKIIGSASYITHVIFITDVDGVYTADPNTDTNADLIRTLHVDATSSSLVTSNMEVNVSASLHDHDVTGGLKVRITKCGIFICSVYYRTHFYRKTP
jgi:isopentenyl phosphate kinase